MAGWKAMLLVGSLTAVGGYALGQLLVPASAAVRSPQITPELAAIEARLDDVEHASRQQRRAVEVAVSSVHRGAAEEEAHEAAADGNGEVGEAVPTDAEVTAEQRQLLTSLTLAARAETPDRSWAPIAERSLRDGIAEASREAVPGVALSDVRCGSTKCALEALLPGGSDEPPQSAVRRLLVQPTFRDFPAMAFGLEDTEDGGAVLSVVMSREGHALEGVSRPEGSDVEGEN